jgi:hypothetical protein
MLQRMSGVCGIGNVGKMVEATKTVRRRREDGGVEDGSRKVELD